MGEPILIHFGAGTRFSGPVWQERTSFPMAETRNISFGPIAAPVGGVRIVFADDNLRFGPRTPPALGSAAELVARAARGARFTGKARPALDTVGRAGPEAAL